MPPPVFQRLIRFLAHDGRTLYGDAILPAGATNIAQATRACVIAPGPASPDHDMTPSPLSPAATLTSEITSVRQLLAPLAPQHIRTVRCLGLNYRAHAHEARMPVPQHPVLFYKPLTAVAGPLDPIPVPAAAQDGGDDGGGGLDYECELAVVIARAARDVRERDALGHVAGYAVANDVSHRGWQLRRGGGQWALGKGFDGWAPLGPGIVSPEVIGDPQSLRIATKVNGAVVQESSTADMIFGVAQTIAFLSQGTTLLPGDIILTGTPQGVGMGRNPPLWLKDGDVVEVSLEGVGSCINKVEFEKIKPSKL